MNSKLTQIAMDFGEPAPPPVPPPMANGNGVAAGTGEDAARAYLAASGVGVRVKSLKQPAAVPPPAPAENRPVETAPEMPTRPTIKVVNGDLFGGTGAEAAVVSEPVSMPEAVAELMPLTEPEPVTEPAMEAEPEATTEPQDIATPAAVVEPVVLAGSAAIVAPADLIAPAVLAEPGPEREPSMAIATVEAPAAEPIPTTRRRTSPGRTTPAKPGTSKRGRKSLKEVAAEAHLIDIPADEVLFSKQYYTMGEVSEMFRVNQSLLRFWETEFDILQPKKNKKGDRYFRPVDIKNLHLIYHLLRLKKYTIEGAKEFLKKNKKAEDRFEVIQRLEQIKAFLVEWKAQL